MIYFPSQRCYITKYDRRVTPVCFPKQGHTFDMTCMSGKVRARVWLLQKTRTVGRFGPAVRRQEADSVGSIPLGSRLVSLLSERVAIDHVMCDPGARAVLKKSQNRWFMDTV